MGESATDLSPAGPILGETLKVWAVSKSIPARFGVTSVVIEDLTYSVGPPRCFNWVLALTCFHRAQA